MSEPNPYQPGAAWAPPSAHLGSQQPIPPGAGIQSAIDAAQGARLGFVNPYYAYGLTQRASDDIHFIARFTRVMIYLWLASIVVGVLLVIFQVVTLSAFLTGLAR